jgi:TPP-dependent pyruvate/acetoin dehydrogenase alpha subunit
LAETETVRVGMYRTMATIACCDEVFRAKLMGGEVTLSYYSPRGQEAISAGVAAAIRPSDYMVTTYRGLHDHIAKGVPLRPLVAEFLGRATGTCKGKGGGMHVTHPASGLMVTTGIVGGGLPIANGLALASQQLGDDRVTVVNFGDGASNIGAFHEALNLAAVWKLPVVFVCHNNRYAESTAYSKGTAATSVAARAHGAYEIPAVTVDGNDPLAVKEAADEAVARARLGSGPSLVEGLTFRFMGHFFGDAGSYIPKDEMHAARELDPIPRYRARLVSDGDASEAQLDLIDSQVRAAVDDAFGFALDSPWPAPDELRFDVYAQEALI